MYTTDIKLEKDPIRQSLLDTIKYYLQISDLELINTYLLHAVKNYEEYSKLCEQASKVHIVDKNNNSRPAKAVQFDFALRTPDDIPAFQSADTSKNQANLYAKYGFLDLIAVLAKYSSEKNIHCIYELAIREIEVCHF